LHDSLFDTNASDRCTNLAFTRRCSVAAPLAVDAAIKAGASDCLQTSNLNESSIARAIRYAIDVYCKERQRQKAEDTVRKL